jgi:hypothetical protein
MDEKMPWQLANWKGSVCLGCPPPPYGVLPRRFAPEGGAGEAGMGVGGERAEPGGGRGHTVGYARGP